MDKKIVFICDECGAEIYEGEDYVSVPNAVICKDCINTLPNYELVEVLGCSWQEA